MPQCPQNVLSILLLSKGLSSLSWGLGTFRYCSKYSWVLLTHEMRESCYCPKTVLLMSSETLTTVLMRESWDILCTICNVLSLSWDVLAYLGLSCLRSIFYLSSSYSISMPLSICLPLVRPWLDSVWLPPKASGADTFNGSGPDRSINLG